MSLYDDFDIKQKTEEVAGWSSGMKLFQSQLQLKKAATNQAKRETRRAASVLAPVFDLNTKKEEDDSDPIGELIMKDKVASPYTSDDIDWVSEEAEYDPLWPNDYEKVVKDLREIKEKEKEREDMERLKRREERLKNERKESRFEPKEDEVDGDETPGLPSAVPAGPRAGVAIAPPPSLQEQVVPKAYGASVAAKIMAKYGFKEGQGLGKKEQGIAMALQVEKTSKRGGRIIHERELAGQGVAIPPPIQLTAQMEAEFAEPLPPPRSASPKSEVSITEIMKSPSKVVLLKNMVGGGEVDAELEPEVKDECNVKYGDVIKVLIHELPDVAPDEAVRIFVEFKRIESAIKAVVDLNGRFFGGRQVKASFYSTEKFNNLELLEQ